MNSIFSRSMDIVDYITTSNLEKVASLVTKCSDVAKTAYIPNYDEQLDKAETDFAVILTDGNSKELRKFAMYTPELVDLNMACLSEDYNKIPEEIIKVAATNLSAAANKYNLTIPEELSKYASKKFVSRYVNIDKINEVAYAEKVASCKSSSKENKKYALHKKYPINTKEEVEKAASWFERNYYNMSIDEMSEFIENVKIAALNQKAALPEQFIKLSSLSVNAFNKNASAHIKLRKNYVLDETALGMYEELASRLEELGVEKVAYALELIDQETGLAGQYDQNVLHPYYAIFGIEKIASEEESFEHKGINVTRTKLASLDKDTLSTIVGNDVVTALCDTDGLAIFASLPTPLKNEIVRELA